MKTINAKTKSRNYEIITEEHSLKIAGKIISKRFQVQKVMIVTDTVVEKLYLSALLSSLKEEGVPTYHCILPTGEENKSLVSLMNIIDALSEHHFGRSDILIALGGGVVSDTAALAASLFLRGMKLTLIPTTLLASVDAAIGGKTGINLESGKNRLGSFYQPHLVIIDSLLLRSLPKDQIENGIAEIIKYSFLSETSLFPLLHQSIDPVSESVSDNFSAQNIDLTYRLNPSLLTELIRTCISIKVKIIEKDENDSGIRQLLNFGHTIGHAIEKKSGYLISHGKAVAIGMFLMTKISVAHKLCEPSALQNLKDELERYSLPFTCHYSLEDLIPFILDDKKRGSDYISLICIKNDEKAEILPVPTTEVYGFLKKGYLE